MRYKCQRNIKELTKDNYANNFGELSLYKTDSNGNIISQVPLGINIHDVIYNPNAVTDKLSKLVR